MKSMNSNDIPKTLLKATARLLRPLIKMLLRHGVSYTAFSELSKQLFFEVAKTEFAIPGKKQTSSRISTMTGLSRKECARLDALPPPDESLDTTAINRAARVISGWTRDKAFQNSQGDPADLPFDGASNSFSALVKRYSGDITARTIADELTRVGAINVTTAGLIHLNTRAYVANSSDIYKLTILGTDVSDLITTIDHNLIAPESPRLQRKVAYNYIPLESLPELNRELTDIAQASLEKMDKVLASKAVDKNKAKKTTKYARAGIGIYFFQGDHS
jgi:hypothetical protein